MSRAVDSSVTYAYLFSVISNCFLPSLPSAGLLWKWLQCLNNLLNNNIYEQWRPGVNNCHNVLCQRICIEPTTWTSCFLAAILSPDMHLLLFWLKRGRLSGWTVVSFDVVLPFIFQWLLVGGMWAEPVLFADLITQGKQLLLVACSLCYSSLKLLRTIAFLLGFLNCIFFLHMACLKMCKLYQYMPTKHQHAFHGPY